MLLVKESDRRISMEQKKYIRAKQICSIVLLATAVISIVVCSIVDAAINSAFTWSLYPISSIIFAGAVIIPMVLRGTKGVLMSLGSLTVLIFPYLYALDKIAGTEGFILKVGGVISAIVLVYLWLMCLILKLCKNRKCIGFGILLILAAPLSVLINYSLSITVTPEAAAFDVWDILDIVILVAGGIGLLGLDFVLIRTKRNDK